MDFWATAKRVDALSQTGKGKPKRGVQTDRGQWLQLTGDEGQLGLLQSGMKFQHSEPQQFGKSKWANLIAIEAASHSEQRTGTQARGDKPTWSEYCLLAKEAKNLAEDLLPDEVRADGSFHDRAYGRSKIINSVLIAYADGVFSFEPEPDDGPNF